jgi:Zn-dependent protease with chaperone function
MQRSFAMKRIVLFVATNLAVVVLLGIVARLLGVDRFLNQSGLNLTSLLIFAAIFGMGGSLISLLMSKWIAKMSVGAQVIEQPTHPNRTLAGRNRPAPGAGGWDRDAGSRDLRFAGTECLRHRRQPQCGAGGGQHRPVATDDRPRKRKRCLAMRSATSPTATW